MQWVRQKSQGNSPANSSAGHGGNNTGTSATQESLPAKLPLDNGCSVEQTLGRPDLLVLGQPSGLQQRLHNVKRGGDTGGECTRQTSRHAVRERVVILRRVHDLGDGLVGDKLSGGERHRHAKRSGIGYVERLETLCLVDGAGALKDTLVYRAMDLHALLDDYFS